MRQDDDVRSKRVPPPPPSGFLPDDDDSARAVALGEGLPVRTDRGMVDSGGKMVGVESDSVAVKVIVAELSRGACTDEVAVAVTERDRMGSVLMFAVAKGVEVFAAEGVRLATEGVQDVDPATTDPVSSPSSPAAPGSGSEPPGTLGQSWATASPDNNIAIKVSGGAIVSLQAFLTLTVSSLRKSMQPEEHALPLMKSVAVQPVRGVLYASVQDWEKPETRWNCDRVMAREVEIRKPRTKYQGGDPRWEASISIIFLPLALLKA